MAVETALSRQLKNLAVPQTNLLIQDKIKKSFLFDHREAASLDRDIIFAYGITGLEKLKTINPLFEKFENNLFSITSKDFERSVQTSSVNKKLDEKITEFLGLLSPYFLVRAAHEALEWLICRYHVHLYNTDALVASVLPYFNTTTFVRVVQLLSIDDSSSRWHWLLPVQKSGVYLEFSAIVNHFNSDGGFRKFVCNLAPDCLKFFKNNTASAAPVISFSMLTIYSALGKKKITDSTITFLFPFILEGLKSNLEKYVSATYLVISKIISSVKLEDALTADIILKVLTHAKPELLQKAFELILLIFQQQSLKSLPRGHCKLLISTKGFLKNLIELSENYEITLLLSALIKVYVPDLFRLYSRRPSSVKYRRLLKFSEQIFNNICLDKKTVTLYVHVVLKSFSGLQEKSKGKDKCMEEVAKMLLETLERKYPDDFDSAVSKYFQKENNKNDKYLHELINDSVCSVKSKMLPDKLIPLALGINHVNTNVRRTSIKYLYKLARLNKSSDKDFIENAFCDRLKDDCPKVVEEVIKYPDVLFLHADKKNILDSFSHILSRPIYEGSPWYQLQICTIHILCEHFDNEKELAFEIFATFMPFIFPLNKMSVVGFLCILKSELCSILPVVQAFEISYALDFDGDSKNDNEQLLLLNNTVLMSLRKYIETKSDLERNAFLNFVRKKNEKLQSNSLLTMFVFGTVYAVVSNAELSQKCIYIENFLSVLDTFTYPKVVYENFTNDMMEKTVIEKCVEALLNSQFPYLIIYNAFYNITKFSKLDLNFLQSTSQLLEKDHTDFIVFNTLVKIFEFCIKHINCGKKKIAANFKNLKLVFIDSQFETIEQLFGFLGLLWSNSTDSVPITLQIAALDSASLSLDEIETCDHMFESYSIYIQLMMAISSSHTEVRKDALSLLASMVKKTENEFTLHSLTKAILEHEAEIITDHTQCYCVSNNWFDPIFEAYIPAHFPPMQDSELKVKYLVLDNFIQVLSDDSISNNMKTHILLCLQQAKSIGILSSYVPIIDKSLMYYTENGGFNDKLNFQILDLLLQKFSPKTAVCLKNDCVETATLLKCLQFVEKCNANEKEIVVLMIKMLSQEFFTSIPSVTLKKKVLNILLSAYLNSPSNLNSKINNVLKKLCTYAYLILKDLLEKGTSVQKGSTLREMKRTRDKEGSEEENVKLFEKETWKKIIVLLELIQSKSKLEECGLLIPELFNLLSKTLKYESLSSVEYVRQLILSSISNCCQHLGKEGLNERQFQVELVVQCIRSSTNPKTHHQALLLLNLAATIFPDYVLNNVMSIFTFMGSSLVRQDDSYSFQVISQTIETIVPSLLEASSHRKENDAMQIVASVIRVFVDSLSDMPRHRQLPLFSKLITTLDPSKYLWIPLAQICDQYATVFTNMALIDVDDWKISPTLEFAVNLHKQFSPAVQTDTCFNLLNFLSLLPDSEKDPEALKSIQNFSEPFNVAAHSKQQLQAYKYNVLAYINLWLSSPAFMSQITDLDAKAFHILENKYETLLEIALKYLQHQQSFDQDCENVQNQYSLIAPLLNLIGHVNALLPCGLFIRIVRHLLKNSEISIQKKAIELLNCKLEQQHLFNEEHDELLLRLLKPLLKVVQKYKDTDTSAEENLVINQQTALYSLHLLTKIIGSKFTSKFHKVLNVVIQILKDNVNEELTVNAFLCLAQLCKSLNVEVLSKLNTFMPIIVNIMTDNKILGMNDCLILGIVTALMSLVENLGGFLSSYMQLIVNSVCIMTTKYLEIQKRIVYDKLLAFQTLLTKDVDLRILLGAIEKSYMDFSFEDSNCIITLMKLLREKLTHSSYEDIKEYSSSLQHFCLVLLDFRNSVPENHSLSPESVSNIEQSIFSSVKTFVMKLPVTHFQTFFKKIYLWATQNEVKQKLRIFTFYGLTSELAKALRNLFVVVAKSFLKHAATELDSNNSSKTDDLNFSDSTILIQHVNNIVDTLYTSFAHDNGQLLDKDGFEALMQPLVDQLESLYEDEKPYQERISKHLSVCIAHFMAAVSDNALWKKMNYQILLKTRHDSPIVRFAAIQVIREVVNIMGDNYLVLLPESIPFLAEVMEDESSEVEQECNLVISEMEKILGEPIRKYF